MIYRAVFICVMLVLVAATAAWLVFDWASGLWWRDVKDAVGGE
jgi:hypothetical protein